MRYRTLLMFFIICGGFVNQIPAQSNGQFIMETAYKDIFPTSAPLHYLEKNYLQSAYTFSHITNANLLRALRKEVGDSQLVFTPLEKTNNKIWSQWDCGTFANITCVSDSHATKILHDSPFIKTKWWWSEKKRYKKFIKEQARLKAIRAAKPQYEKEVYRIAEPWVLADGKTAAIYIVLMRDSGQQVEVIYLYNKVDGMWQLSKKING